MNLLNLNEFVKLKWVFEKQKCDWLTSQNKSLFMHFLSAQASCPPGQIGSSVDSNGRGVLASINELG